jgi:hypothetical protein
VKALDRGELSASLPVTLPPGKQTLIVYRLRGPHDRPGIFPHFMEHEPRRRWEDNIKMDLREVGWGGMDWINLAQDRNRWRALVNTVMNLRVP